ncbi:relaxase/mobilization nuclease domain-containing protein [Gymnodinialimonas hymeniacidonis]|uniref:relaxase/mobilization nuclease domain-containing protein n=1 Tax=Gymnodinialimonas hymeniacidonis TaxID=3126508 RepID=UPI0034C6C37E
MVRHVGARRRSAPLTQHIGYLQRDGVGKDGQRADLFGQDNDTLEGRTLSATWEEDRHHFRFIVSPEDAHQLEDLRAFSRDLMACAERDLGTKLDWVAVDHWNTDNPHVHILLRGKADDGRDLVISRDYISQGLRARAEDLVQLELGPRSAREITSDLERQVTTERWTDLDRGLRALADDHAGIVDLRRGTPEPRDPELRRLMIGRTQKLERLGLATPILPAVWELKPGVEKTLSELGLRGDIIKTMHRALANGPDRADFEIAIEGTPTAPILGRLVERGLQDEHHGTAYAIIDGVDGRVHHLRFQDIAATGDTAHGGIAETRLWTPKAGGRARLALVGRSDLDLSAQIGAEGATWLDRLQLARDRVPLGGSGFGAEVRAALDRRADHLVDIGLAQKQGQRVVFSRDLLSTLRARELDAQSAKLVAGTGLIRYRPHEGDAVEGTYRQRLCLASGRFAMIDDGLGFSLVPWTPQLDRQLGRSVSGMVCSGGGIDWTLGRNRGLSR